MTINIRDLCALLSENQSLNLDSFSAADWDSLASKAQMEGVAPLIYWNLSKSGRISAAPQFAFRALRAAYSATWKQNQNIFNELEILTREFNDAEIPVVLLKGACFALTVYPDIGLRPMGDLDLLAPLAKQNEAIQIAKTLGYAETNPEASPGLNDLMSHAIVLQKTGERAVMLEIHKSLAADKSFTYAAPVHWFWEQTEALNHPRFPNLRMLSPAAQILYASAHAMLQHGGKNAPLRWFYDIDRVIRFYETRIDWELLLSQAEKIEWGSALNAALAQTRQYFNTPISENALVRLSALSDRHDKLIEILQVKPATHTLEEFQKMRTLNAYGRFRLMLALVAPSPSYMRWRYQFKSAWVLPIYYLVRWGTIGRDAFRTAVALVFAKRN